MDADVSSVGFDQRLQDCCIATSHTFITICQASDGKDDRNKEASVAGAIAPSCPKTGYANLHL
jgi:hypothetical protein